MALLVAKHDQDRALVEPIDRRGSERSASSEGEQASKLTQLPAPVGGAVGPPARTVQTEPAFDGEPVAGEESGGLAQLPGGDEIGTAARHGGAGAVADDGGGQGDGEPVGGGVDLGSEAGIGFQGLSFLGQEVGHGEPRIAPRGHGEMIAVGPSHSAAHARCRALASGTAGIAPVRLLSRVESATNQARSSSCRWP